HSRLEKAPRIRFEMSANVCFRYAAQLGEYCQRIRQRNLTQIALFPHDCALIVTLVCVCKENTKPHRDRAQISRVLLSHRPLWRIERHSREIKMAQFMRERGHQRRQISKLHW